MHSAPAQSRNRRIAPVAILVLGITAFLIWKNISRQSAETTLHQATSEPRALKLPLVDRPSGDAVARMSPVLLKSLGLIEGMSLPERIVTLQTYDEQALTDDESQLLLHLLLQGPADGETAGWYSEYMHEICCLLGRRKAVLPPFASVLAAIAADDKREETVRDYSLQHLRLLWESADATLRLRIEASIEAIAATDSPLAPSAILSLHLLGSPANAPVPSADSLPSLSAKSFAIPDSRITPFLAKMLSQPPGPSQTVARMTAARILRERGITTHLADLRAIAADASGEQAVVRMAAIAAIAELGSPADIDFLNTLDRSDPRIHSALSHSLPPKP
jgi:hypothetical protein